MTDLLILIEGVTDRIGFARDRDIFDSEFGYSEVCSSCDRECNQGDYTQCETYLREVERRKE